MRSTARRRPEVGDLPPDSCILSPTSYILHSISFSRMPKRKKFTQKEQDEVLKLLSAGCSRTTAARCVRRSPTTLRNEILENPEFAEQVVKAEEGTELYYLARIRSAAQKEQYWRAAAWVLERRLPERYGSKKPETLTVEQVQKFMTTCMQIIAEELPDEELRTKILDRLAEELGEG